MLKRILYIIVIKNYLLGGFFQEKKFDLVKNNLKLQSGLLNNKKNYYNNIVNNLFPFTFNLISYKINIIPSFSSYNLPFIFLKKEEGKKIVLLYNEIIYNSYYIEILEEEINFLKSKILLLRDIAPIYSSEFLYEIQHTEIAILKKNIEIDKAKKKIEENKKILKLEFNYSNKIDNSGFIVPILYFNENKINSYLFESYFYKKSLYELQESFNNYWTIGNLKIQYKNNKFLILYETNLKDNLSKNNLVKYNKFIENILLSKKLIENKISLLKILRIQKKFLEINRKNLENYINNYEEYNSIDYIINLYKKKRELINLKKLQLQNLYKKINSIFLIYLELVPLNESRKIYQVAFII